MRIVFPDKRLEVNCKCREKPWKSPGSNLRRQIAVPIGRIALYRLSQTPIFKQIYVCLGSCILVDTVKSTTCHFSVFLGTWSHCTQYFSFNTAQLPFPSLQDFNCLCRSGFTGSLCENDVDPCIRTTCQNGGTCYNEVVSAGRVEPLCVCRFGFVGTLCENGEKIYIFHQECNVD